MARQNVTISVTRETLRKAKILAARRETSISGLLAEQIELLVGEDEAYERRSGRPLHCSIRAFIWAARSAEAGTTGMSDKTFVDTNVLIYAHDVDAKAKHQVAKNVLRELWSQRTGVLSMQVLQEFYVNVTRKIASPLPKDAARRIVNSYAIWCMETTPAEISAAFRIEDESKIGFWDALILASAAKCGADRILSEDLNAKQMIAGIPIQNPFAQR